jgi:hypothetical protein
MFLLWGKDMNRGNEKVKKIKERREKKAGLGKRQRIELKWFDGNGKGGRGGNGSYNFPADFPHV